MFLLQFLKRGDFEQHVNVHGISFVLTDSGEYAMLVGRKVSSHATHGSGRVGTSRGNDEQVEVLMSKEDIKNGASFDNIELLEVMKPLWGINKTNYVATSSDV